MEKVQFEKVTFYRVGKDRKIKKITYYRRKKIPTLKQFAVRKYFQQLMKKYGNIKETVNLPEEGRKLPKNVYEIRKHLGLKAEDLITPELIEEYKKYIETHYKSKAHK